jgi:hypothetical protein
MSLSREAVVPPLKKAITCRSRFLRKPALSAQTM